MTSVDPSIHSQPHPMAGKTLKIKYGPLAGREFVVEDWWDRLTGNSWLSMTGNPACFAYAFRVSKQIYFVPDDDEVVYGKIGVLGHIVHETEINHGGYDVKV